MLRRPMVNAKGRAKLVEAGLGSSARTIARESGRDSVMNTSLLVVPVCSCPSRPPNLAMSLPIRDAGESKIQAQG